MLIIMSHMNLKNKYYLKQIQKIVWKTKLILLTVLVDLFCHFNNNFVYLTKLTLWELTTECS